SGSVNALPGASLKRQHHTRPSAVSPYAAPSLDELDASEANTCSPGTRIGAALLVRKPASSRPPNPPPQQCTAPDSSSPHVPDRMATIDLKRGMSGTRTGDELHGYAPAPSPQVSVIEALPSLTSRYHTQQSVSPSTVSTEVHSS